MNYEPSHLNALTEKIFGCACHVHNELGRGFLEKVCENALLIELAQNGMLVQQQQPLPAYYKAHLVGDYIADLIVEGCIIIELKAIARLTEEHAAQGINCLTATRLPVCLVLNVATSVEVKRLVVPAFPCKI